MESLQELQVQDIHSALRHHFQHLVNFLNLVSIDEISQLVSLIEICRQKKKTIFTMGNGGSGATAMHMASDFSRIVGQDGHYLRVNCLNSNMCAFSATANDFGYEKVFYKQLEGLIEDNDLIIGISASGNSPNCIEAFALASERSAATVALLGFDGGEMKKMANYYVHIPISDYFIVESIHLAISHAIMFSLQVLNKPS